MPVITNPADSYERVRERADQADPWVMYLLARKDLPLSLEQAMPVAGAAAVRCGERFRRHPDHAEAFAAWEATSFRKIALRADVAQLERAACELAAVSVDADGVPAVVCVVPMRRNQRPELLAELRPFTDAKRGEVSLQLPAGNLVYVIRDGVMKSAGKAMAQAAHAAMMCRLLLPDRYRTELDAWIEAGAGGRVICVDDSDWEQIKAELDCVAVRDAGLTQVESGTETVIAVPPSQAAGLPQLTAS